MLSTFQTERGAIVVRSEDIKLIRDTSEGRSELVCLHGSELFHADITGSALDNLARISEEELDTIARVTDHQQRAQQRMSAGMPILPVKRGRP